MKKLENTFRKMERRAYIFLKSGLGTLGFISVLLLINILKNTYVGAHRYIFVQSCTRLWRILFCLLCLLWAEVFLLTLR
jgi:hypothetical protein